MASEPIDLKAARDAAAALEEEAAHLLLLTEHAEAETLGKMRVLLRDARRSLEAIHSALWPTPPWRQPASGGGADATA